MDRQPETPEWSLEIERRRSTLLDNLLLTAIISGLVALILTYVTLPEEMDAQERWGEMIPFILGWVIVLIPWIWRGLGYRVRALIILSVAYGLAIFIFLRGGLPGSGRVWMLLPPILGFVLLGTRVGIWAGVVSILTYVFFAAAFSQGWTASLIAAEDPNALATWISEGASFLVIAAAMVAILQSFNRSWVEALTEASKINRELRERTEELKRANTKLYRQTSQLHATTEIAHAGSSILDPKELLGKVVDWVQEGFSPMGVYYVGLFLLDEEEQVGELRAATGEAGRLLLDVGQNIEPDETSTVGWCIIHGEPRLALDGGEEAARSRNTILEPTRSEIALPLRSRGRILGALSVQSTQERAFGEEDVTILQTMADQVAVAIDNANLFSQTEAALEEVQAIQRRYLIQAWRQYLDRRPMDRIEYTQPGVTAARGDSLREARRQAIESGETVAIDAIKDENTAAQQAAMVVPLKLRGQVIGTIALQETRDKRPWTTEEIIQAETVAEQMALTIENLRLMDETQRRAGRELTIRQIADQMQQAIDMESLMRTAAEELNRVLGTARAYVHLYADSSRRPGTGPLREETD